MTGLGSVSITAFTDDISVFLRNQASYRAFLELFEEYANLSGAFLNAEKSKAFRFGGFHGCLPGGIQYVDAVKVIGVYFQDGEVTERNWEDAVHRTTQVFANAADFNLSLDTKVTVVKTKACAYAFYIGHIALIPKLFASRLASLIGAFL